MLWTDRERERERGIEEGVKKKKWKQAEGEEGELGERERGMRMGS